MKKQSLLVKVIQNVFGYAVAVACLIWVFRDIQKGQLLQDMRAINWPLAACGILVDITAYLFQSLRWRAVLSPFGNISPKKTLKAIYAGIFINLIIPLRVGELIRVYLISRFAMINFSTAFSTLLVEYLFDGLCLTIGAGILVFLLPLPPHFHQAGLILGTALLLAIAGFLVIVFNNIRLAVFFEKYKSITFRPLRILINFIGNIAKSLHAIGTTTALFRAAFFSGCMLAAHAAGFWLVLRAYGIELSFIIGAAILIFKYIALIIPNAPSNVGTYQFVLVLALVFFGVNKTQATGFSVAVFILLLLPQFIFGAIAFFRSGSTMGQMRAAISNVRNS
jgi:uncharacterized protein (TIRG00374 family)